jgi:hypothetical protein
VLVEPSVSSAAPSRVLDIHYDAPPACPTSDDFRARLDLHMAAGAPAGASVEVRVTEGGETFLGTVAVAHRETTEQRALEASQCEELVNALALATAFLLDGREDAPEERTPEPPRPPPAAPKEAAAPGTAERTPASAPGALAWIGALGGLHETWGPQPIPSVAAAFEAEWQNGQRGVVSPSVRASASYAAGAFDSIAVRAMALALDACPLRGQIGTSITMRPCVGVELGRIEGRGRGLLNVETQGSGWFAATALARVKVPVAGPLAGTADVGGTLPFTRPRFFAGPDPGSPGATLFRVPAFGYSVAVGFLVRIP